LLRIAAGAVNQIILGTAGAFRLTDILVIPQSNLTALRGLILANPLVLRGIKGPFQRMITLREILARHISTLVLQINEVQGRRASSPFAVESLIRLKAFPSLSSGAILADFTNLPKSWTKNVSAHSYFFKALRGFNSFSIIREPSLQTAVQIDFVKAIEIIFIRFEI